MKPNWKIGTTGWRRIDDFTTIDIKEGATPTINQAANDLREYKIRAELGIAFYARPETLQHATRSAMRALRLGIYGEIYPLLQRLRLEIEGGSRDRSLEIWDRMHAIIMKDTL